jgi:hypothetical protein
MGCFGNAHSGDQMGRLSRVETLIVSTALLAL